MTDLEKISQVELSELLLNRDSLIWKACLTKFTQIARFVVHTLSLDKEYEDYAVEAIEKIILNIEAKCYNPQNLIGFGRTIIKFEFYKDLKRLRKFTDLETIDIEVEAFAAIEQLDTLRNREIQLECLDLVLRKWDDTKCLELIKRFYYDDLAHVEIAELLGIQEHNSRKKLSRCRNDLREFYFNTLKELQHEEF